MATIPPEESTQPMSEPQDATAEVDDPPSSPSHNRIMSDNDAQAQLIASLRSQITDLFTQVSQLNSKLVASYDRVSDLEDNLHVTSSNLRSSTIKISQLELERTQHLSALNTGLLVEKSQVTAELTRLMERATEEAASRSSAVQAKQEIEKELDDLSANLFDQANTMVAEARLARAKSEQKVVEAERRLGEAEDAVREMGRTLQRVNAEREELQGVVGKGKYPAGQLVKQTRLLSTHVPYQEFLLFVAHLRGLHSSAPSAMPAMTTLLPLPFLARLISEDSDPTLRLDLAPSLNWLSRRSVLAAIHSGNLTIEPMSTTALIQSYTSSSGGTTIPGLPTIGGLSIGGLGAANHTMNCALCGTPIFPGLDLSSFSTSGNAQNGSGSSSSSSWSTSIFKRPGANQNQSQGLTPPPSPPPTQSKAKLVTVDSTKNMLESLPTQVYVFRITSPPTPVTSTLNLPPLATSSPAPPPVHPRASRARSGTVSQAPFASTSAQSPIRPSSASHLSKPSSSSTYSLASSTYSQPSYSPLTTTFSAATSSPSKPTHTSSTSSSSSNSPIYPLCTSSTHSWCLIRLRATCSLWAFVRGGIVERVWDEEVPFGLPMGTTNGIGGNGGGIGGNGLPPPPPTHPKEAPHAIDVGSIQKSPTRPPRRRGLWGTLGSLGERAANWSGGSSSSRPSTPIIEEKEKSLPVLPTSTGAGDAGDGVEGNTSTSDAGAGVKAPASAAPPPLPRRSEGRGRTVSSALTSADIPASGPPVSNPNPNPNPNPTSDPTPVSDSGDAKKEDHHEVVFSASPHNTPPHSPRVSTESRPATPHTPHTPAAPVAGGDIAQTIPSRTASPAPGGTPPPIPRRAMARGPRPMNLSRAGTPTEVKEEEEVKTEAEGTGEGKAEKKETTGEEEDAEEGKGEEKVEAKVEEEGEGGVKEPEREPEEKVEDEKTEKEEKNANEEGAEEKEVHTGAEEVHADGLETVNEEEKVEPAQADPNEESNLDKVDETAVSNAKPDDEPAELTSPHDETSDSSEDKAGEPYPYIGSATWEERTWKEVLRLKEGMFWARVGGVKSESTV